MTPRYLPLLATLSCAVCLWLCGVAMGAADANDKFVGAWANRNGQVGQTYTFKADGTFEFTVYADIQAGTIKKRFSGEWKFADKVMSLTIKKSDPAGGEGKVLKLSVMDANADHIVFREDPKDAGTQAEYERLEQ